tara:strand:- start:4034 stop:4240 length:207 start_codon:yes stop_codon:yes gene_type:complete
MINSGREWDWMDVKKKNMSEEEFLKKLYELNEEMDELLDKSYINQHYHLIDLLIDEIEKHLSNEKGII